jgi:hypothetical protein
MIQISSKCQGKSTLSEIDDSTGECHDYNKRGQEALADPCDPAVGGLLAGHEDVELGAGWDACIASLGRPAAQQGIKALMARGFHQPGDVENRLGYYLGQIAR